MKKTISILTAVALTFAVTPTAVFAHGHGCGRKAASATRYSACSVDDCNIIGTHGHDGVYYYGHYIGDGHDYHQLCNVEGCTAASSHEHDGVTCFPHANGDGHGYHHNSLN